jgi:hypothetical protein
MIYKDSGTVIPVINFIKPEIDKIRMRSVFDKSFVPQYESWVNNITNKLPYIYHMSWWSVYNKIINYKLYWNNFWISMYAEQRPENYNPFFNKSFDVVTDDEIKFAATKIENDCAGFIFHKQIDLNNIPKTNHILFDKGVPEIVKDWAGKNKTIKE